MADRSKYYQIPLSVTVELTTHCNERCIHCYIADHNRPEMTTKEAFRLLAELKKAGVFYLVLTGGEVHVRKDFTEILGEARRLRLCTSIFTNATLVTPESATYYAEIGVHEVGVSLYSNDPEIHDSITTRKGSWQETIRGIQYLCDSGVSVIIKCPIMSTNFSTYGGVLDFAESVGAKAQMTPTITVMDSGCNSTIPLRLNAEQLDIVIADPRVLEQGGECNQFSELADSVPCTAVFNGGAVDSRGNVYPCNQFLVPVGNVMEQPFADIWSQSHTIKLLRMHRVADLTECRSCKVFCYCTRCPGSAFLEDGLLLGCSKVAKDVALSRMRCGIYPQPSAIFASE